MSDEATELDTPVFLLAMPQVQDPFFHRGVVLLLHHDEEGSFGFIVNRPTELRVEDILGGMEISWQGSRDEIAFFGGPVQPQLGTVLFRPDRPPQNGETPGEEVAPGMRMTHQVDDLTQLARTPPERFRLILGYAGWGEGQLVEEFLRNDWITAPVDHDLIFSTRPEQAWEEALRSVGIDPASLPAWGTGSDGGFTN